jgi:hypothetical protein
MPSSEPRRSSISKGWADYQPQSAGEAERASGKSTDDEPQLPTEADASSKSSKGNANVDQSDTSGVGAEQEMIILEVTDGLDGADTSIPKPDPASQTRVEATTSSVGATTTSSVAKATAFACAIVLDPLSSRLVRYNNIAQVLALLYTAIYTPFELALLGDQRGFWTPEGMVLARVWFNTLVDLIFLGDMAIVMVTPYKLEGHYQYERSPWKIFKRYVSGWFFSDLLAVFPWYLVGQDNLRVLRLLRLVKISKGLQYADQLQVAYSVSYLNMQLLRFFTIFVVTSHWMACTWCFVATYAQEQNPEYDKTWRDALADGKLTGDIYTDSVAATYLAASHFAIMTITSVGYGDVAPQNRVEYAVAIALQVIGTLVFTYLMAMFLSLVAVVEEEPWKHARRMDQLTVMMNQAKLSKDEKTALRQFLIKARDAIRRRDGEHVFNLLSPNLQATLLARQYLSSLRQAKLFAEVSESFLVEVCKVIKPTMLAPGETLSDPQTLYLIDKGLIIYKGQLMGAGKLIGADFMLTNPELRPTTFPTVLTFVEALTLHRIELEEVSDLFPEDAKIMRRGVIWTALRQYCIKLGRNQIFSGNIRKMKHLDHRRKTELILTHLFQRQASADPDPDSNKAAGGTNGTSELSDTIQRSAAKRKEGVPTHRESHYSEGSVRRDPGGLARLKLKSNQLKLMDDVSTLMGKSAKMEEQMGKMGEQMGWICSILSDGAKVKSNRASTKSSTALLFGAANATGRRETMNM